jgi:hypothetical protein
LTYGVLWSRMADQKYVDPYNLDLLRGWKRSQLKLLKLFTKMDYVSQPYMAMASGSMLGSPELGGKMTALTRADLIQKVGVDDDGYQCWQLNEDRVNKQTLRDLLDSMSID